MGNELLTVHDYWQEPDRYETVNGWWKAHGHTGKFPENEIPKLAIMVKRNGMPCAFLAAYMAVDIGIAFLDYAVSAPGQSIKQAKDAMERACIGARQALKVHGYSIARIITSEAIARALKQFGWGREKSGLVQLAIAI